MQRALWSSPALAHTLTSRQGARREMTRTMFAVALLVGLVTALSLCTLASLVSAAEELEVGAYNMGKFQSEGRGACRSDGHGQEVCCATSATELNHLILFQALHGGTTWDTASCPCLHGWAGVHCDRLGFILELRLSAMGLSGTLGTHVCSLPHLEVLDLSHNTGMSGSVPSCFGTNLPRLRELRLFNTGVTSVPTTVEALLSSPNSLFYS